MRVLLSCLGLFLLGAVPALAIEGVKPGAAAADAVFTEVDKKLIREFFGPSAKREGRDHAERDQREKSKAKAKDKDVGRDEHRGDGDLPPGIAKRDQLPPGLEMQIERFGRLPPGLAKRDLPPDLERRLGKLRPGLVRRVVDNDLVLIEAATEIVLDVLFDVIADN
jgi:hypothetical protein